MQHSLTRSPLPFLLCGLLLAACGVSETEPTPAFGEDLGTTEAEVCGSASVTSLAIAAISTELGEMAGNGSWAVGYPANAVRLEYYVDNALQSSEERLGTSGAWYFSKSGVSCGTHTFLVKAFPMVVDSAGTRSTCWSNTSRSASQSVTEPCPHYCGDGICNGDEDAWSCNWDCGYCGDSICGQYEDSWNCSMDCGNCGCTTRFCEICYIQ